MRMLPFFKPKKGFMVAGGGLETSSGGGGGGGGSSYNYSTTKYDTGKKWLNGNTVYGLVIEGNLPATTTATTIATIPNMETLITINGIMRNVGDDYDNAYNMENYESGSVSAHFKVDLLNGSIMHAHQSTVFNGKPFRAIIEYVETTV